MSELGSLLRQAREAKSLTFAQVERETHIRQAYLQALESGQREALPDYVYTRGLVSSYARYLGADEAEVQRLLAAEYMPENDPSQEVGSHQPLGVSLYEPRQSWLTFIIIVLVIGGLAFAAWWYWPTLKPWWRWFYRMVSPTHTAQIVNSQYTATPTLMPEESPTSTKKVVVTLPAPTSAALPLPTPGLKPTATVVVTIAPTATPVTGIRLVAKASSDAWLRVTVDGKVVFEQTLKAGESREWQAKESIILRSGNAGGTNVNINDKDMGTLGEAGRIVERQWLWQNNKVSEATPVG